MPRVEIAVIVSIDGRQIWGRKAEVSGDSARRLTPEEQEQIIDGATEALDQVIDKKKSNDSYQPDEGSPMAKKMESEDEGETETEEEPEEKPEPKRTTKTAARKPVKKGKTNKR